MNNDSSKGKTLALLRGFKNLIGVGLYLLLLGIVLEALTVIARRWASFPFPLAVEMRIVLTFPCVIFCLLGVTWFNLSINLVEVHFLNGESELITYGPFNYVRHPLYATLLITLPPLMIIWFADLMFFIPWVLVVLLSHFVVSFEERGLIEIFGDDYRRYQRYVPALLPYKGAGGRRYREHLAGTALGESERRDE